MVRFKGGVRKIGGAPQKSNLGKVDFPSLEGGLDKVQVFKIEFGVLKRNSSPFESRAGKIQAWTAKARLVEENSLAGETAPRKIRRIPAERDLVKPKLFSHKNRTCEGAAHPTA